ncbi:hypothetical protein PAE9249_01374 [Paenibacillus sp. CECT 9249]|uniref:copper amine oxidase N-terminal domain-containing protein n=1 Tax=Paenibacillus sp. CECT 9249 TaxID=2845385 RepID=UPI001E43458D|nr:copper amine oxidase N-terminal domain-containing protein [Paenibacillus sp. CECT 9249]CAH0118877.1 hypothetical protein PAE9249_01374 [Paenibacillus sp. CECT 9249]
MKNSTRRKISSICAAALLMVTVCSPASAAKPDQTSSISLYVNDKEVESEQRPMIVEQKVLVPLRLVSERFDQTSVNWDASKQRVTIINQNRSIELTVGDRQAVIDGHNTKLDVPPLVKDGTTYVPIRFIAESLQAAVTWKPSAKAVLIVEPSFADRQNDTFIVLIDKMIEEGKEPYEIHTTIYKNFTALQYMFDQHPYLIESFDRYRVYDVWFADDDPHQFAVRMINRAKSGDIPVYSREWIGFSEMPLSDIVLYVEPVDGKMKVTWGAEISSTDSAVPFGDSKLETGLKQATDMDWGYQKQTGKLPPSDPAFTRYFLDYFNDLVPMQ